MLDMYVFCLKKLNKPEEYVPAALQMLSKAAKLHVSSATIGSTKSSRALTPFSNVNLRSILKASGALSKTIQISLDDFFGDIRLANHIEHSLQSDEFSVALSLQVRAACAIDRVSVKMVSTIDGVSRELLLTSDAMIECDVGSFTMHVKSKVYTIALVRF